MARVRVVYETLRDLVNKDQKGFVTPSVFNSLAGVAQLNIFNRLFDDIKDAHRNRRASFDPGRDKSLLKQMREDLAYFVKRETLEPFDNPDGPVGTFRKPIDLARIISIQTGTRASASTEYDTPVVAEIVYDEEKMNRILRSNLSAPSTDFSISIYRGNPYTSYLYFNVLQVSSISKLLRGTSRHVTFNECARFRGRRDP